MDMPSLSTVISVGLGAVAIMLIISFIVNNIFVVKQQTAVVIERLGKFSRVALAGLHVKLPFIERRAGTESLRITQMELMVETKTKDNVFVHVVLSIQYFIVPTKVFDAFYKLNEPEKQISAYVFDVVRSKVPKLDLDDAFEKKDEIGSAVKETLAADMQGYGYGIAAALVTDINPDAKVKSAMNDINAAQREQVAATSRGEGLRILAVKNAEAEAQSKALQGKGIADQRRAIIEGLRESVTAFTESVPGTKAEDVMMLVMMTQYFDTLKSIGESGKATSVLLPYAPGSVRDIATQMRDAIISGERL